MGYVDKHRSNIRQGSRLSMAVPEKKKPDSSDFFAKFADRNPYEYAKAAKESEKFITPSRVEKNDKIEKLWSEFKEQASRIDKHNKRIQDNKEVPADSDFSYEEIHKEMRRCVDSIIELDPDNYEALWNRSSLHKDKGEYEESLKCLEKITNYLKPDDVDSWFERHELLKILERYPEALDCLDKILKIKPEIESDVLNAKGIVLGESGDGEEALKCFELAFTKPGTAGHFALWVNKGTVLSNLEKPTEAIECFEKALELKPDNVFALFNKALTLHHLGKYPEAIKFFDQAGAASVTAYNDQAYDEKIDSWNFLVMLMRRKAETLFALYPQDKNGTQPALTCFDTGLEVIDMMSTGIESLPHPEFGPLLFGKGMATEYLQAEKQDSPHIQSVALACFTEVLELDPKFGLAWYQLGSVWMNLGALGKLDDTMDKITFCFKKALKFSESLNQEQIEFCKTWIEIEADTGELGDFGKRFAALYAKKFDANRPDPSNPDFKTLLKDWKQNHPDSDNDLKKKENKKSNVDDPADK